MSLHYIICTRCGYRFLGEEDPICWACREIDKLEKH